MEKQFVNGFESWAETHHEIVTAISILESVLGGDNEATKAREAGGTTAVYQLAIDLTDLFERENAGREWDGEFYEAIEAFCDLHL